MAQIRAHQILGIKLQLILKPTYIFVLPRNRKPQKNSSLSSKTGEKCQICLGRISVFQMFSTGKVLNNIDEDVTIFDYSNIVELQKKFKGTALFHGL